MPVEAVVIAVEAVVASVDRHSQATLQRVLGRARDPEHAYEESVVPTDRALTPYPLSKRDGEAF